MKIKLFAAGLLMAILLIPVTVYAQIDLESTTDTILDPCGVIAEYDEEECELPAIFITTTRVNLRSTPCTTYPRILLVQQGRRVEVTDFRCGEWFAVTYNGNTGYMAAEFLREAPAPGEVGSVELIQWSEARQLLTRGTIFTVVDVRTGLTWQMAAFSLGNHADVETITAEDTATMFQAFGRWTWDTRPILVLIGDRTLAASLNGMPHAGSTRSGNNMNGHVCIHFRGSRTHNGSTFHERCHQNSITEAYNTASAW